ncbi:MAG: type IV pilus secretin PilQ [Gammaproteobacteria bacterium]|nr:type IV pilus secretin PilQ [Gammaproteobacteria bacterium]
MIRKNLFAPAARRFRWAGLLLLAWAAALPAQDEPRRALQAVDFVELDGGRVLFTLTLSEEAPEPVTFTVEKPARLALDLPETRSQVAERVRKLAVGKARSIMVAEAKGRTRVVVELTELVPHIVRRQGNRLTVELGGGADAPAPAASAIVPAAPALPPPSVSQIANVDFRRGEKGEGRIVVMLTDPRTVVDVREEGGKVRAKFRNTAVGEMLLRRLDVLDFATPVKFIDITRLGADSEIAVTPVAGADFEQLAYQAGNLFTLELQPLTAEKQEEKTRLEPQYTGERISLSFQSVDVRSLLQIIADVAGTNMVVSDTVQGTVAMRLQNVPWDQALDIILRTKGLGMRRQGNVMLVAPLSELTEREKAELEAQKAKTQLGPLVSEIIQVNYAKASDIKAILTASSGGGGSSSSSGGAAGAAGGSSLLSERGRVTVDERTNTLLVQETREKLADIRALIAKLDIPVKQVLIESRIVIANNDFTKELGARFGVSAVARNGANGLLSTSGSATANDTAVSSFLDNGGFPVTLGALNDRFNVSLPVAGPSGRIAFAVLGSDYLVDLELSALQAEGRGEVQSAPRVITANGKEASIESGVEIPYQEASSSGATSISFKKAVLSLKVTPQVTPDQRVIMDLEVKKDSVGQQVANVTGGTIPSIDTREVNTQVLVENGQTVVLGGIYEETTNSLVTKVPFLGDLPLIGAIFRNKRNVSNKAELLIFITPKVLSDSLKIEN